MEIQTDGNRIKNTEGTAYLVINDNHWIEIEVVTEDNEKKFVITGPGGSIIAVVNDPCPGRQQEREQWD